MKNKDKKKYQKELAKKSIERYFEILEDNNNPDFNNRYVVEIKKIAQAFNIRLSREDKQKFCSKCNTYFKVENRMIRFNPKLGAKEYICKICSNVKRFKY